MRIVNETSYPDADVRRLVRYGMRGLGGLRGVPVTIKPSRKHAHGFAAFRRRITIYMPPPDRFPTRGYRRHRGSPVNHDWRDWREALVALAAHEGRHLDLFTSGYDGRANGRVTKSSQAIEMNCEAYERRRLDDYREGKA